jgi:two-component system OmpR family sensor kinase
MSIRLRLTLAYSSILALTLIIFGVALYTVQSRDTLNALKQDLVRSSDRLVEAALRAEAPVREQEPPGREPPPPKPFAEYSSDQIFQDLREREIVRILDEDGNLVASPFGREEDALPLSDEGFATLQSQHDWWETGVVFDENTLIYNRPIVRDGELVSIIQVARSLTERERTLSSLAVTLGVAGGFTILLAFAVGWTLSGFSLRPIHRITQTAHAIGDERDFSRRVEYTGPTDEVGQLALTFNQMLARLQNAYQNLEHSLEMQRNFIADVSHELRTPLTTLRGNLSLLQRDASAPSEEQEDILVDMVDESERLIRLINDLLMIATADARRSLTRERFEIEPLLTESVRQAKVLDDQREVNLECPTGLVIHGDRDAFKQVILILLDNALKHSNGSIDLQITANDAWVQIDLSDQGPGIPADQLERIFDRFYRGESTAASQGYGLGLPIAKDLVEKMGGTITIRSKLEVGSVFSLRFPTEANMPQVPDFT